MPLIFVLSVTAIREAFEDYGRYKSDEIVNAKLTCVFAQPGSSESAPSASSAADATMHTEAASASDEKTLTFSDLPSSSSTVSAAAAAAVAAAAAAASSSAAPSLLQSPYFKNVGWRDIRVGDIVCVKDGQDFPVDLVLLASSSLAGTCSIETSSLDGYALHVCLLCKL
jgi:hypothetical protein